MIEYKGVNYYELKDCKYINPDIKLAGLQSLLYELQIAKRKNCYNICNYSIWLPFEFDYPKGWENDFKQSREIYGEYCLVVLETKVAQSPSRQSRKLHRADGIPGAYYVTNLYLTKEAMMKIREYVETSPQFFPIRYTDFE